MVLPMEPKSPHLNASKSPSKGNTLLPSFHQYSHIYEHIPSWRMSGTPDSYEVYQRTPQICPTLLVVQDFLMIPCKHDNKMMMQRS